MTDNFIRAPRFDFGTAVTQLFNLPGGKGYLFRVIGWGTVLILLSYALLGVPIVKAYFKFFVQMAFLDAQSGEPDLAQVMRVMQPLFAAMGWFTLLYVFLYGTYVAVETALYRNIIRGEDKGFFPLRFGYDEWRVLGTRIVIAIILYAAFMAIYFVGAIVGMIFIGLATVGESGALAAVGVILFLVLIIFLLLGMVYLAIRFAPASAISVRDKEFSPMSSFKMMKTYFWPTLGAVVTIGVIGYLALSIISTGAIVILLFTSGIIPFLVTVEAGSEQIPDFGPLLDTLASAGFIVPLVIVMAISVFLSLLYLGAIWSVWGYIAKLTAPRDI